LIPDTWRFKITPTTCTKYVKGQAVSRCPENPTRIYERILIEDVGKLQAKITLITGDTPTTLFIRMASTATAPK
jgi:hypothetical protein